MTMHLVGPWLTTTGKAKTRRKYRTAANAAAAREQASSWQTLLREHGVKTEPRRRGRADFQPMKVRPLQYRGSDQPQIPSLPFTGGACAKPQDKVYTGDKIRGIGTMHKSNAVPIFSDQEAQDIAKMRR